MASSTITTDSYELYMWAIIIGIAVGLLIVGVRHIASWFE